MDEYPFWLGAEPLVLASRSAGRRQLLQAAGIPLICVPTDLDERGVESGLSEEIRQKPDALAAALARAKALDVSARHPGQFVLGCDQVLSAGEKIFHKAGDLETAIRQLVELSGRQHHLHAAAALVREGAVVSQCADTVSLTMRDFSEAFVREYAATQKAALLGTVGGYEIEGMGVHLFNQVQGDQSTIVGLPLLPVLTMLGECGLLLR